ncbi:amidase [bacterium]|nr:amidase [bacterium]
MVPPIAQATNPLFDTLTDAVLGIELRRFSCVDLVADCLRRIDALEPLIHAWVSVDPVGAIAAASAADARRAAGSPLSRLDGIPFGVKDIIDVAGWPTVAGFSPWNGRIASADAAIVAEMNRIGMIPLGKTVTTQFASIDPPVTRNPWNLERTPGGSSSGSCAAVACRMVPVALGSQTGGSINRPASFCGVAGLKLAFGDWPVDGVVPCADRLDTLGPIVPDCQDLRLLLATIFPRSLHESASTHDRQHGKFRILNVVGRFRDLADPAMNEAVAQATDRLTSAGHQVDTNDCRDFFDEALWETHRVVMMSGCYRTHRDWFAEHPGDYRPKIRSWVESGEDLLRNQPEAVKSSGNSQNALKQEFKRRFGGFEALLVPAARGTAPTPETTGDPVMNAPWTLLGVPSMTVPVTVSEDGLPLGVQLIATSRERGAIDRMIRAARDLR